MHMTTDATRAQEEAFQTVLEHETLLKTCVAAVIWDPHLADDTLADVRLAIVQSWEQYDPSRPFGPWACAVARNVARQNLRKETMQRRLLSLDTQELVASDVEGLGDEPVLNRFKQALNVCLQRLSPRHQQLIRMHYYKRRSFGQISYRFGTSIPTLYVIFARMRGKLSDCIQSKVSRL
jgi:RNA polymerase sigma-70 factor, ECF subfamily